MKINRIYAVKKVTRNDYDKNNTAYGGGHVPPGALYVY